MPKDEWEAKRADDLAWKVTVLDRKALKRIRATIYADKKRLQSPSTVLWFGKYRGHSISTIQLKDPAYLQWLSQQSVTDSNWQMQALVAYLRRLPSKSNIAP